MRYTSTPLMKAYSSDEGRTWTEPVATPLWSVWANVVRLGDEILVASSGRPGIGFWISPQADGESWVGYDVEAEHSRLLPSDPWDAAHGTGTTSYTGIAEVEPGVVLLACECIMTLPAGVAAAEAAAAAAAEAAAAEAAAAAAAAAATAADC